MKQSESEKPPSNISNTIQQYSKQYPLSTYFLLKKYSVFYYSYAHVQINNLVFNEKSHITAKFKDFLVIDDETEFLRRYYSNEENPSRLNRIYSFYHTYSKIFPNYIVLPESKYLYRNIRKKQRMIDAFNQIKREEEENRVNLDIGKKNNKNGLVIFDQSIQKSIKQYELSQTQSKAIRDDDTINSFSISISLKRIDEYNMMTSTLNESNVSLVCIIQAMSNQYQYNPNEPIIIETPKKNNKKIEYDTTCVPSTKIKDNKNNEQQTLSALNNNRKFISHKVAVSNPEIQNKKIQIINNYHNIIVPEGSNAIININTNYYPCSTNNNTSKDNSNALKAKDKSKSPILKDNKLFDNIKPSIMSKSIQKNNYFKSVSISKPSNSNTKTIKKEANTLQRKFKDISIGNSFKSPEKKSSNCPIALDSTKTINPTNHTIPFFKNKHISSAMTELQNKINPFQMRFTKKKENELKNNQISISSNSLSKKSYDIQLTKNKDLKMVFPTDIDKEQSNLQCDIEPKATKTEMKNRYKNFMENAKKDVMTLRNSFNTSKKQSTTIDTLSKRKNSKVFTSNSTQKQNQFSKITIQKKLLLSPKQFDYYTTNSKVNQSKGGQTTKIKITPKIVKKDKSTISANSNTNSSINANANSNLKILEPIGIKSINFKALNVNTSKMKFIKKY